MYPCPFSRKGPILLLCYPKFPKHEDELVGEAGLWFPLTGQVKWSHWPFQGTLHSQFMEKPLSPPEAQRTHFLCLEW